MLFHTYSTARCCGYTRCIIQTQTLPTACWSQPKVLQSQRKALPTHLLWQPHKNQPKISNCGKATIQEWSLWFCGCGALTCSQPVLDALLCCHTAELGKRPVNEQRAFQTNFKYRRSKCCWAAAHTGHFSQTMVWSSLETGLLLFRLLAWPPRHVRGE